MRSEKYFFFKFVALNFATFREQLSVREYALNKLERYQDEYACERVQPTTSSSSNQIASRSLYGMYYDTGTVDSSNTPNCMRTEISNYLNFHTTLVYKI